MAEALQETEFRNGPFHISACTAENGSGETVPWLRAKEACEMLGYSNSSSALDRHVPDIEKARLPVQTGRGVQYASFITEEGLYRIILRSKLPSAVAFQDWVVRDVLPSIRKKGAYIDPNATREQLVEIHAELHRQLGYGAILKMDTAQLERELALRANVNNDDQTKTAIQDRLEIKKALEHERALDAERSKLRKAGDAAPTFVAADLAARDRIWFRFDKGASWVHDKNDKPLRPVNDEEKEKFKIEA